jgi:hypothetical protein
VPFHAGVPDRAAADVQALNQLHGERVGQR